jgi:hypothetical protein
MRNLARKMMQGGSPNNFSKKKMDLKIGFGSTGQKGLFNFAPSKINCC